MTLSEGEGHFCCLNLCNTHDFGNAACFNAVCFHINWKVPAACDLNIIVKPEGLLKVTGSHIHSKSDNILETVLDRDVVTTGYKQEVILIYILPI